MIEFRNVSKAWPDGTFAAQDVTFTIPSRTTTVLVGTSGSGKTTLLRMVNRLVDPSSGQVLIDDADVAQAAPVQLRRSIGYVLQNAGLLPHRRVVDNVATVPRLQGVSARIARDRANELLELVGLSATIGRRYPWQLSGGQQQRVGVARALASDPNILLMDEPFGAVDPLVRAELQQELLRLQRELGKTVVFVTHDIDEALLLGHQIVVLRTGGVVAQIGSSRDIVEQPADDFVANFVGVTRDRVLRRMDAGSDLLVDEHGRIIGRIEP